MSFRRKLALGTLVLFAITGFTLVPTVMGPTDPPPDIPELITTPDINMARSLPPEKMVDPPIYLASDDDGIVPPPPEKILC